MKEKIKKNIKEIQSFSALSNEEIETFRIKYLGKKGLINSYFIDFKLLNNDKKKDVGQLLNQLKNSAHSKVEELKKQLSPSNSQPARPTAQCRSSGAAPCTRRPAAN